jgi:hypothetical protein
MKFCEICLRQKLVMSKLLSAWGFVSTLFNNEVKHYVINCIITFKKKSKTGSRFGSGSASGSAYFLLEAEAPEAEAPEAEAPEVEALRVEVEAETVALKILVLVLMYSKWKQPIIRVGAGWGEQH